MRRSTCLTRSETGGWDEKYSNAPAWSAEISANRFSARTAAWGSNPAAPARRTPSRSASNSNSREYPLLSICRSIGPAPGSREPTAFRKVLAVSLSLAWPRRMCPSSWPRKNAISSRSAPHKSSSGSVTNTNPPGSAKALIMLEETAQKRNWRRGSFTAAASRAPTLSTTSWLA